MTHLVEQRYNCAKAKKILLGRRCENKTRGTKLYHRPNPNATGRHDEYLDGKGHPTRDQSDPSHIYSPEGVWWN